MKIPTKITKRQYTAFNKQNEKWLKHDIDSQHHDLLVELGILSNADIFPLSNELPEAQATLREWNKEVKGSFTYFVRTRLKIRKAYERGLKK